jgi:Transglycosylase SLT domain
MRRVNNLAVTLPEIVNARAGHGHLAAMSSVFCHICARYWNYRKLKSLPRPVRRDLFMKSLPKFALAAMAALLVSPGAMAQSRAQYESMVASHARANNVPEALVHRVIVRESKYHPSLVGRGGTIGLMQIKLPTARGLGYTGDAAGLRDPDTNLAWGTKYLAGAYRAANGDHGRAVRYYASGYYYAAKRQRLEQPTLSAPVLASGAPPKIVALPKETSKEVLKDAAAVPVASTVTPESAANPVEAAAAPVVMVAKPRRHPRRLTEAKAQVPRPPAVIGAGAKAAKPR